MSGKIRLISAVVIAAALATAAAAQTTQTRGAEKTPAVHSTDGKQTEPRNTDAAATRSTVGMAPAPSAPLHNYACAPSVQADCNKLDWFPE